MSMDVIPTNDTPTKKPRKRTRRVKEAEAQPVAQPVSQPVETKAASSTPDLDAYVEQLATAPEPARASPRPRRVEPDDARVVAAQVGRGAHEASPAFTEVRPGDACPGVTDIFWRSTGRAIDRGLPAELVKPLVLAFEAVLLSTGSPAETTRRFDGLANDAYALRRYGHGSPSRKGQEYNTLQASLVVEFLAGESGAFLVGNVEHVRRVAPTMGWRLREVVVEHLLGMYRDARGVTAGLPGERAMLTTTIGQEVDRLGDARRRLVKELGEQKASGLDAMLVNAWVEPDPLVLTNWVDSAVAKKANRQMAAALAQAHVHATVAEG